MDKAGIAQYQTTSSDKNGSTQSATTAAKAHAPITAAKAALSRLSSPSHHTVYPAHSPQSCCATPTTKAAIATVPAVAAIGNLQRSIAAIAAIARIAESAKATATAKRNAANSAYPNAIYSSDRPAIGTKFVVVAADIDLIAGVIKSSRKEVKDLKS
jgi:hypothetical protein